MSFKLDSIKIEGTIGDQDIIRTFIIENMGDLNYEARCRKHIPDECGGHYDCRKDNYCNGHYCPEDGDPCRKNCSQGH